MLKVTAGRSNRRQIRFDGQGVGAGEEVSSAGELSVDGVEEAGVSSKDDEEAGVAVSSGVGVGVDFFVVVEDFLGEDVGEASALLEEDDFFEVEALLPLVPVFLLLAVEDDVPDFFAVELLVLLD